MMSESGNGDVETASKEQAVETAEATDSENIRGSLPEDIRAALTKRAFSPGALRKLLRDTYYMGPIGIGRGGWRGIHGGGRPGTQMRRPGGALYNFPRSWRYAALERGLNLGLIAHTGGGRFATTERGVAVLRGTDVCPDCGVHREPYIRHSVYVRNPNSEGGREESHELVTACPECGANGYGTAGDSTTTSYEQFQRDEDYLDGVRERLADHPDTRVFGVEGEVDPDAADSTPDVDSDAVEDLLDEFVEEQTPPEARDLFSATDEGLFGRPVVTIPSDGTFYRFKGTPESIAVSRTDTEGDIHITVDSEGRLKVGMSYEIAVEHNVKDVLHNQAEDAKWSGDYWTIGADRLARAVSKLTIGFSEDEWRGAAYYPDSEDEPTGDETWFTVTVTEDAMDAVTTPMLGVDADGELI